MESEALLILDLLYKEQNIFQRFQTSAFSLLHGCALKYKEYHFTVCAQSDLALEYLLYAIAFLLKG